MKQLILVITVLLPILAPGQINSVDLNIKGPYCRQNFSYQENPLLLQLHGLTPDQTYQVSLTDDLQECDHLLQFDASTPNKNREKNQLQFEATGSDQRLLFLPGCNKKGRVNLSVYCISCEGSRYEKVMAGITTTVNEDIPYLVEDILVDGECFNVFDISSRGANGQIGTFANGSTSIGFEEGIIMSTGHIADAIGPNSDTKTTTEMAFLNNDPDLRAATNYIANLYDVAIIEFDFVPTVEQVTFEYVFASEEYCEYANTNFNDAFGFFIRGPGINGNFFMGSDNIAQIPDNGDYVSVNSVNLTNNSAYFHDNTPPTDTCYSGEEFAINLVEYDGFTTVLTAVANVMPCSTYHIKMAIADLNDKIFDSAVFLKAKSFRAGAPTTIMAAAQGERVDDHSPYESCGSAYVVFERVTADLSEDYEVTFSLSPLSTATPGVDFSILPDTIIIPAGQATDTLFLDIYSDQLQEGVETIILDLDGACSCITRSVQIDIHDPPPIEIDLQDQAACLGESVTLTPVVSGGTPGFTYSWDDGTAGPSLQVTTAEEPDTVTFTVTDFCNLTQDTSIVVSAIYPNAQIVVGTDSICNGNPSASLPVQITGNGPFDLVYEFEGVLDTITGIDSNQFQLPANNIGTYHLVAIDEAGCPGVAFSSGEVFFHEITLDIDSTNISCTGANDGQILVGVNGGTGPYIYDWNQSLPDTARVTGLPPGNYEVMVTDAEGCFASMQTNIEEPAPLQASVTSLENIDCEHLNGGTISANASGGTGNYTYAWNSGQTDATITDLSVGTYLLTITDENDCTTEISRSIVDLVNYPQAMAQSSGILDCVQDEIQLSSTGSSTGAMMTYTWEDSLGNVIGSGAEDLPWGLPGTYFLVVTDTSNHCQTVDSTIVLSNQDFPIVEAGLPDTINCLEATALLDGSNSSAGPEFNYTWTSIDGHFLGDPSLQTVQVDQGGMYYLEVYNESNSCSRIDSVLILQDTELPVVAIASPDTVNCYYPEINLDGTASSSGPGFSYSWTTADGNILTDTSDPMIQVNSGGTYTLAVYNNDNGCERLDSVFIAANFNYPQITAGADNTLNCQFTALNLQGNIANSNASQVINWQSLNGGVLSATDVLQPEVTDPDQYVLTVTDMANGCTSTDTVTIAGDFNYPVAAPDSSAVLNCVTPQLPLDASSSVGADQFAWSTGLGNILSGSTAAIANIDAPGTYTLIVTNSENFCRDTATFVVFEDIAPPIANIDSQEVEDCELPSFVLSSTGSSSGPEFAYQWSTTNGIILDGQQAQTLLIGSGGAYQLLIVNTNNGCRDSTSTEVVVDPGIPIAVAEAPDKITCDQPLVTLDGTNSSITNTMLFNWVGLDNPVSANDQSILAQADQPGRYELIVTNTESGCITRDTVVVGIDTLSPIAIGESLDTLSCTLMMANLSAENSTTGTEYTYFWSSPDALPIDNATSQEATVFNAGTYQLLVTDTSNGCTSTDLVEVPIDTLLPMVSLSPPDTITCAEPTINIVGQPLSPHALSPVWTTSDGHFLDGINTFEPLVDESGTYNLLVTDLVNGCINFYNVEVIKNTTLPIASAGPDALLDCNTTTLTLDGSASSNGNYSYQWETDNGQIITGESGLTPEISAPGVYQIIVTDNVNGCTSIDMTSVVQDTVAPDLNISTPEELNCITFNTTLTGNSDESNVPYTYQWFGSDGQPLAGATGFTINVETPGIYRWMATNTVNGCSQVISEEVIQNITPPIAEAGPTGILTCKNREIQLEGTASSTGEHYRYAWNGSPEDPIAGRSTLTPTVNTPGAYTLVVTNNENGCTDSDQVLVIEEIPRTANLSVDTGPCNDDFGTILIEDIEGGFGPYSFSIDGGNTFQSSPIFSSLTSGDYNVVIRDINGCEIETETNIPEGLEVVINVVPLVELQLGDLYQINTTLSVPVSTISEITWSPADGLSCTDCLNPTVVPEQSTQYQLRVVNEDGCVGTALVNLRVDRRASIYIPNAFSPYNEDGINDRFYIFAKEGLVNEVLKFQVFTRWGELLFEKKNFPPNDSNFGWDGLNRGQRMNPGVFVYWAEVELFDGSVIILKGDITLLN